MLSRKEVSSRGGQARAKLQKEEAIKEYYKNPNICKYCGKVIELEGKKPSQIRVKKFCNNSCSAKYNNSNGSINKKKIRHCTICGTEISSRKAKYCKKCKPTVRMCRKQNPTLTILSERTKGELFQNSKSWQVARNRICKNAREIYWENKKDKKCDICGYDKHTEVCHIKPVSSFDDETLISEINKVDNLIGLCPNCHWEFDNNLLTLEQIKG